MATPAITLSSAGTAVSLLGLVEEAAALEEAGALLCGDFDVARRQEEDLVGDALHPAVERVRQPTGEIDQALGEILVRALEVEDDGDRILELVRDLLRVVEAARHDEVDPHGGGPRNRGDARPQDGRPL